MPVAANGTVAAAGLLTTVFLHGFAFTLYINYLSNSVGRKRKINQLTNSDFGEEEEALIEVERQMLFKVRFLSLFM